MTITRNISISAPGTPAGYMAAAERLGKFYAENDCDIIGQPKLPASLQGDARLVDEVDERTRREERTYRFLGSLIQSPDEGNCWYISGFAAICRGHQSMDPDADYPAPIDMEITTELYTTRAEAEAELTRRLQRAVTAIRLDGQSRDIKIDNVSVRVNFSRQHGNLYLRVQAWLDGQAIIEPDKWIEDTDVRQAARDWSDAPDTFQYALYPRLAALMS